MTRVGRQVEALHPPTLSISVCQSVARPLTLFFFRFLTFHSQVCRSINVRHPFSILSPTCTPAVTALRIPAAATALSKTGNVPGSDEHESLPKHGIVQPGVHGAAGAAEASICRRRRRQQLQQLKPLPQRLQLILPSCTCVRAVQQSVYHLR